MGADPPQARGDRRGGRERRERRGVLRRRRAAQHLGTAARGRPREGRPGRRGPARVAGAPTRFCARAAAGTVRRGPPRNPGDPGRRASGTSSPPSPSTCSTGRSAIGPGGTTPAAGRLVGTLERLGVATLGDLAGLPRIAVADRFGALGLQAHDLASGLDTPLRPRVPHEDLVQAIGLPEAAYGTQLDRALDLLIERLLGDPLREGRAIRSLRLEARLAGGGSWSARVAMRSASSSADRLRLALAPRLGELSAPATTLVLRALELAESGGAQGSLGDDPAERRRERLAEAVKQVRAAAGRDSMLRVLDVDPDSRVPERWTTLAPFNEAGR